MLLEVLLEVRSVFMGPSSKKYVRSMSAGIKICMRSVILTLKKTLNPA